MTHPPPGDDPIDRQLADAFRSTQAPPALVERLRGMAELAEPKTTSRGLPWLGGVLVVLAAAAVLFLVARPPTEHARVEPVEPAPAVPPPPVEPKRLAVPEGMRAVQVRIDSAGEAAVTAGRRVDLIRSTEEGTSTAFRDLLVLATGSSRLTVAVPADDVGGLVLLADQERFAPAVLDGERRLVGVYVSKSDRDLVQDGDHVDLLLMPRDEPSEVLTIAEDVQVVSRGRVPASVTVRVADQAAAERLAHAFTLGRITLALH